MDSASIPLSFLLPAQSPFPQFLCWVFKPEVSLALCLKYAATELNRTTASA